MIAFRNTPRISRINLLDLLNISSTWSSLQIPLEFFGYEFIIIMISTARMRLIRLWLSSIKGYTECFNFYRVFLKLWGCRCKLHSSKTQISPSFWSTHKYNQQGFLISISSSALILKKVSSTCHPTQLIKLLSPLLIKISNVIVENGSYIEQFELLKVTMQTKCHSPFFFH